MASGYRFLNPYNFVRFLNKPQEGGSLLAKCPPPPNDRYVGLTGRITCEIKVETPVFVADSHAVEKINEEGHKRYRFFEVDGEPAIPASSLRGMIRSMFEAVTNSCLPVFDGDRLLYRRLRMEEALMLVPAIVERSEGGLRLRLLPGTDDGEAWQHRYDKEWQRQYGRMRVQYAAWVRGWQRPLRGGKTFRENPQHPYSTRGVLKEDLEKLTHGQECYAILSQKPIAHPQRPFQFWNVEGISDDQATLRAKCPGRAIVRGYLCKTNQNIENKHDERFFFRSATSVWAETIEVSPDVRKAYDALIADYREQNKRDLEKRTKEHHPPHSPYQKGDKERTWVSAISPHIYDDNLKELAPGQLVYAQLDGSHAQHPTLRYITPVMISRLAYNRPIGKLLISEHLHRCTDPDALCPACRVFGWVWDKPKKDAPRVAYTGRVRLSHAQFKRNDFDVEHKDTTLAILSTPKPTTTLFYLAKSDGSPADAQTDYDTKGARLRGRKVYRHFGKKAWNWKEASPDGIKPTDQNRTVRQVLKTGACSSFAVDFENLAALELGALLWVLELEDGMFHRLGFGKPLGLGSVSIKITKLEILQPAQRYAALQAKDAWQPIPPEQRKNLKEEFIKAMRNTYGTAQFDPLLADLRALLREPPIVHAHYPRTKCEPQAEAENFNWFIGNKRRHPPEPLPLAPEDKMGFRVWDRDGKEVEC